MRAVWVKSYSAAVWKFRLILSRFLQAMAGAKLIELRSPRHGDSGIPVTPNITAVSMTVTAVQGARQVMR
jgi:hypothetical protein